MSAPLFELKDVSFFYQRQPALKELSLHIGSGERIVLLGANGSGKSTLLRLLDALYFPCSGELRAFGRSISESAMADDETNFAFRKRVGLVFQNPDVQLFNPTVFDELAFGPLQLGWERQRILQGIDAVLKRFAIAHLRNRAPHRLSGGEKKRVALASVLILEPEVLLLDEPTAALDPESQGEVIRLLIDSRNSGRTIVTATHDLDIIEDIADFVFVLADGKLAGAGTPAEILANHSLLEKSHLLHAHWHVHSGGAAHCHRHEHGHPHAHGSVSPDTSDAATSLPLSKSEEQG